jgi:hypothetical protein
MKSIIIELWGGIPMKVRYSIFFGLGFCLCGILWLTSCSTMKEAVKNYPSDNPLEQLTQDVIKSQTGVDVDISFWDDDEDKGWN